MCYEKKEGGNRAVTEGHGLGSSEEDESRVDDVRTNTNNVSGELRNTTQITQQQQQQSLPPVIRWERFLPHRSLRVLLVEYDDSTRQVVSALLRNCCYEVTAVANGIQAWKILTDVNNRIDLVLTEVVMPVMSGIGLLCKIMRHKTYKNIPVIMMSCHDSMGLVFKCLSKGAVDFLVKPIRKNELKNLWQHVWRRCHSSSGSGSGSESGTQSKKSVKTERKDDSDNTSSSEENENGSNGGSINDGSDNGSGTQSSWTKKAVDVDSPQIQSHSDAPDSTCAQVIHTKLGTLSNGRVHEPKEFHHQVNNPETAATGEGLQNSGCEHQREHIARTKDDNKQTKLPEEDKKILENELPKHEDLKVVSRSNAPDGKTKDYGMPNGTSPMPLVEGKACKDSRDSPSLELTLTQPRDMRDCQSTLNDDRNILRHSDQSAFTKYNTASSVYKGLTGSVGSCSPHDSSVAMKAGAPCNNFPSHSGSIPLHQQSNGSSQNNDMASTAKCVSPNPETCKHKSVSVSAFKPFQSPVYRPVQNSRAASSKPVLPEDKAQALLQQHNSHHLQGQSHHNIHKPEPGQDISINVIEGPAERVLVNSNVTGSVSGSNHGSNFQSRSGTQFKGEQPNGESDNGAAGNSTNRKIIGGADDDRAAQREAALMKFRQKRKERCFDKRVRYHSRKKLAEQRPRVKGQFVRRSDSTSGNDCSSSGLVSEDNSSDNLR